MLRTALQNSAFQPPSLPNEKAHLYRTSESLLLHEEPRDNSSARPPAAAATAFAMAPKKKPAGLTTPQARKRKANLKAMALEKKSEARNKILNAQLDEWFDMFDTDGDKQFNREELTKLLSHLNPGAPPSADVISLVMKDATGVFGISLEAGPTSRKSHIYDNSDQRTIMHGIESGTIHRDKLVPVVKKYSAYIREQVRRHQKKAHARAHAAARRGRALARVTPLAQQRTSACPVSQAKIDAVFDKFDTDNSGTLVRQCPIDAHGTLPRPAWPRPPHPRRLRWPQERSELLPLMKCICPDVEPDEEDLKFMLAQVDVDGDESINRNELLPLLAVWKELAQEKAPTGDAPFSPGQEDSFSRGEDTLSPMKGGMSLMQPSGSNSVAAQLGTPASEPKVAKSATCVLL